MSQPIEDGYSALAQAIDTALSDAGFIPDGKLEIDPPSPFAPNGDETELVTAAALVKIETKSVQTFLGAPLPRYAVERQVRLELGAAGPDEDARKASLAAAVAAVAAIIVTNYQLGGRAERALLTASTDDDLPPNGSKTIMDLTIRVRANDPLGMS